jgi:hypothetical protein
MREVSRHKSMQVLADYVRDPSSSATTPTRVFSEALRWQDDQTFFGPGGTAMTDDE